MKSVIENLKTLVFIGFLSFVCASLLPGCGGGGDDPDINFETISLSLDADANLSSATSVDLLLVYDVDLLKALVKLKSQDYFASSDQIRRDHPEMVDVVHWELTPGQVITDHPIPLRSDSPYGALLFADYLTPGTHRLRIGSSDEIHVRLRRFDFCILEQGCMPALKDKTYTGDTLKSGAITGSLRRPPEDQGGRDPLDTATDIVDTTRQEEEKASGLVKKALNLASPE